MSSKNSTYWCACLRNNQKSFEYFDYFLSTFDVFHYVSQDNSDSFQKLSNQPDKSWLMMRVRSYQLID